MRRNLAVAVLRCSNAPLWREYQLAAANQWRSGEEMQARHDQLVAGMLRYASVHVPRYRDLVASWGVDPQVLTSGHLTQFPLLNKSALTIERDAHRADDCRPEDRLKSHTGGSSGVIFHFEYDRRTKDARRAGDLLGRSWTGWRIGDDVAYVWGHSGDVSAAASLRARLADVLMHRRTVLNAFDMDDAVIAAYVRKLQRQQPTLIIGYASSLAFLAEYMRRRGLDGIRPRGIISSAESLGPEKRAIISTVFGCPVYDRYGSREFANVAQQCDPLSGLHVFHDRLHVEIIRQDGAACDPGELGEIVVTDLDNRAMPFIRYRTGDLGILSDEPCRCGRHSPVLATVQGRMSEIIVGPNGKYYACPGPTWLGADIPGVGQLQLIQSSLTDIEVRIVPGPEWTDQSRARIGDRMRLLLGEVHVTVTLTDHIAPAASGKHQIVISSVSPFGGTQGAA